MIILLCVKCFTAFNHKSNNDYKTITTQLSDLSLIVIMQHELKVK